MIDGRHFGDWVPQGHGKLDSFEDALAVSCNVFFADLGLHLGRERLENFMHAAGFDAQANLGIFQVPLGKTVGRVFNNFETAFFAMVGRDSFGSWSAPQPRAERSKDQIARLADARTAMIAARRMGCSFAK